MRVGVAGGEVVATLTVLARQVCVGRAMLPTACIRDVTTLKAQRGQGYGARMIRETLEALRGDGYVLAYLDGIKDFYGRFGFAPVVPFTALHVQADDLAELREGRGRVRPATAERHSRAGAPLRRGLGRAHRQPGPAGRPLALAAGRP